MTFRYKGKTYKVVPYFYKLILKNKRFYYGIKYSRWSANPELLGVNYFSSSKEIKEEDILEYKVLRTYDVEDKEQYKECVKKLKLLEARFLRFYNLLRNEMCANKNVYGDTFVHFDNHVLMKHLKSEKMRKIVSKSMRENNPMFNEESRNKMKETLKRNWKNKTEEEKEEIRETIRRSWKNKTEEEKEEIREKNRKANKESEKVQEYMRNRNPMFNKNSQRKMIKTKMYNMLKTQEQYMISCGMKQINEEQWEKYRFEYYKNTGKKKYFYTWKSYVKWVIKNED